MFLLHDHLVLIVKYRRQVFDGEISDFAKDMFAEVGSKYNISLVEWNHDKDHIHILFKARPTLNYQSSSTPIRVQFLD